MPPHPDAVTEARPGRAILTLTFPTLLAFDTATEVCSVALARGARIVERSEVVGQHHSDRVLPMAQQLLVDEGVTLSEIDVIAFGAGPGSFTGLRIACGVAQGAAYGIDARVLPIGNLAALAMRAGELAAGARRVAAAIDARMSEVYWAVYDLADGDAVEVIAPSLSSAQALPALLAPLTPDTLAGDAQTVFADALATIPVAHRLPQARASARTIALLAQRAQARGESVAPSLAMPLYVRDRVALTIDERRAAQAARAA
ncbi:MAG: tRNA (adenosine(37)-N6)-threonylcarbamoyltransferase complex dimerization subunit type 1 TsaB [Burkholderiaceae bacterium]|nr:tRNA (adenosine(37)-N6)-threonylcarbamoyltransferase complex dimerization subunit type 1 TsaB [Burkholderiaceae bacterium]